MRRVLISLGSALLLTFAIAGSAFAAHCINESKREGAGVHVNVMINPFDPTAPPAFEGANGAGRLPGGFADLYLDFDLSGTVTPGDVQIENDVFLISNHSQKGNPAQGEPGVLPPILDGRDPGGEGRGVGVAHQ